MWVFFYSLNRPFCVATSQFTNSFRKCTLKRVYYFLWNKEPNIGYLCLLFILHPSLIIWNEVATLNASTHFSIFKIRKIYEKQVSEQFNELFLILLYDQTFITHMIISKRILILIHLLPSFHRLITGKRYNFSFLTIMFFSALVYVVTL